MRLDAETPIRCGLLVVRLPRFLCVLCLAAPMAAEGGARDDSKRVPALTREGPCRGQCAERCFGLVRRAAAAAASTAGPSSWGIGGPVLGGAWWAASTATRGPVGEWSCSERLFLFYLFIVLPRAVVELLVGEWSCRERFRHIQSGSSRRCLPSEAFWADAQTGRARGAWHWFGPSSGVPEPSAQ